MSTNWIQQVCARGLHSRPKLITYCNQSRNSRSILKLSSLSRKIIGMLALRMYLLSLDQGMQPRIVPREETIRRRKFRNIFRNSSNAERIILLLCVSSFIIFNIWRLQFKVCYLRFIMKLFMQFTYNIS